MSKRLNKKRKLKAVTRSERQEAKAANAKATAKAIVAREMGRGTSPFEREMPTAQTKMIVPTVDQKLDVSCDYTPQALSTLALGIIAAALKRGWGSSLSTATGGDIYYAYAFLIRTFENCQKGTIPTIQAAPHWFWELCESLIPKSTKFKTGTIQYKWSEIAPVALDPTFSVSEWSKVILGQPDPVNTTVNGFVAIVPPVNPYTEELGQTAIAGMWGFLNQQGSPLGTVGARPDKLVMSRDVSAFSMSYAEFGTSLFQTCGIYSTCQSESPITAPLFSKFGIYNLQNFRGTQKFRRSVGGPSMIGPTLMNLTNPLQLKNKGCPALKFYNFDDFAQRLTFTLIQAIQAAVSVSATNIDPVLYTCPLSPQQFQIMLRQSLLLHFDNEYAQDVYWKSNPVNPAEGAVDFVPFVVGPNGVSISGTVIQPKFPKFFCEFVRGATGFSLSLEGGGFIQWVSVLGRNPSTPPIPNYKYEVSNGVAATIFSSVSGEVPINIIDASYNNGTSFVDLNGEEYVSYVAAWNNWIEKLPTLLAPSTIGEVLGCRVLRAGIWTRILRTVATQVLNGKPVNAPTITGPKKKELGARIVRDLRTAPSPTDIDYTNSVVLLGMSGNSNFPSALLKFLNHMFLPVFWGNSDLEQGSITAYQTNVVEPYYLPATSGSHVNFISTSNVSQYTSMYNLNYIAATVDVKSNLNTSKTEMEVELDKITEEGEGGFFTDLVRGAGKIASVVDQFIG